MLTNEPKRVPSFTTYFLLALFTAYIIFDCIACSKSVQPNAKLSLLSDERDRLKAENQRLTRT